MLDKKMLIKFFIITVAIFFGILLIAPATLVAQDEPYGGLTVEGHNLYLEAFNSEGLNWQFDLLKDGISVYSESGSVVNNSYKGEDCWLYTYTISVEGSYSATLKIFDEPVLEYTLDFEILKEESSLDIVVGLPGEITTFNLFAKNSKGLSWGFSLIDKSGGEVYSDYGQIDLDNWWNGPITCVLPEGSYSADFHIKVANGVIWRVFKDFTVGIVEKDITGLPEGKIVFISDRDGNYEIYIMNTDGSDQTRLTHTSSEEEWPCFSPDGSKIAFMSNRDGNFEIYIMNIDGSGQTNLTNNPKDDSVPSFSPDGSKIVFESDRDGNGEIYIMNVDGSEQTNLTNTREWELGPCLSPDGTKIAFRSDRDTNGETYAFSPDEDVNWEIFIMNADGSDQTRLTNNQVWDWEPHFSPDGSKIVFTSVLLDKNSVIYIMNADGSDQTRLTNNSEKVGDLDPSFSPDGSKIVFASVQDGNYEIYIMNTDGSKQTRLTNNPARGREPRIYFSESKGKVDNENEYFRPAGPFTPEITRKIPTFIDIIDIIKTKPAVALTTVFLAIITMIPFAAASELFKIVLSENEEDLRRKIRKIRPVAYLRNLNEKIEKRMGAKMGRHLMARNMVQLLGVILLYGLAYSLLDPTWEPFSISGLVLFLDMAIVYGIVGIADDIMQWRALKKWEVPAGFSVQPKNLLVSVISISASRLLALVPGMMFGAPAALQVDKSTLGIIKRDKLSKISFITLLVIGSGLWLLTLATQPLQKHYGSGTLHDMIGGIEGFLLIGFAVALQNTFIQMLGFTGGFGQTMRKRNRWVWFVGLVATAFVFYVTLITQRPGLVEALQETGVIVFLSISFTFIVVSFVLWLFFYFRKKYKLL